jgi:hypothetical protein
MRVRARVRARVHAWVFCDVFLALFFTLKCQQQKSKKQNKSQQRKKVSWVFVCHQSLKTLKDYENKKRSKIWALERKRTN